MTEESTLAEAPNAERQAVVVGNPVVGEPTSVASSQRSVRRRGRLLGMLAASAVAIGMIAALASPASGQVDAGGAWARETVTCNRTNHTVTMDFLAVGYPSDVIGGGPTSPYFVPLPVYVKVWQTINGRWVQGSWNPIKYSTRVTVPKSGTSYWYFEYAFLTRSNTFLYRGEYAGGGPGYGWYSDGWYQTLSSCVS